MIEPEERPYDNLVQLPVEDGELMRMLAWCDNLASDRHLIVYKKVVAGEWTPDENVTAALKGGSYARHLSYAVVFSDAELVHAFCLEFCL